MTRPEQRRNPLKTMFLIAGIGVTSLALVCAGGFVLLLLLGTAGAEDTVGEPARPSRTTATPQVGDAMLQTPPMVTYRVSASGTQHPVNVTYQNADGNTEQRDLQLSYDWEEDFALHPGAFLYVSVQNGEASGSVRCEIAVDGVIINEASSSGAYVIATCSERVPG